MSETIKKCGECTFFRRTDADGKMIPEKYIHGFGLVAVGFCKNSFGMLLGDVHAQMLCRYWLVADLAERSDVKLDIAA